MLLNQLLEEEEDLAGESTTKEASGDSDAESATGRGEGEGDRRDGEVGG